MFNFIRLTLVVIVVSFESLNVEAVFGIRPPVLLDPPESVSTRDGTISTKWFDQKLDHFKPTDSRTWKQRYFVNEDYFNSSTKNHVFLMLGGESQINIRWMNYGAWMQSVKQYGGLMFYLEHRFYGESQPLGNLSTENLIYLSSVQALDDIATFIQAKNTEYQLPDDVKWIVYGGSYPGSLAAWLRQKYPHLVAGSMSSSGPLEAILDFNEYLQVVIDGLATHSQTCVDNVKAAFNELEQIVASCLEDSEIYTSLNTAFGFCDPVEQSDGNEKDLANLFEVLTDNIFAYVVQYEGRLGNVSITAVCDILNDDSIGSQLDRLAEVNKMVQGSSCTSHRYDTLVQEWQNITADPTKMMRQWVYQTCTEFGFFQTSSQKVPVFGSRFDITFFTELCQDVFGYEFHENFTSEAIESTNNRYGGKSIKISNVVYFHGSLDPWHVLGKLESSNSSYKVVIVDGVSHCANMYEASENDSQALAESRKLIHGLVGQWLEVENDGGDDGGGGGDNDGGDNDGGDNGGGDNDGGDDDDGDNFGLTIKPNVPLLMSMALAVRWLLSNKLY